MTWWQAWMAGQVDGLLVAALLLAVMVAGRHRLSPAFRSALGMLGLARLALPPMVIAPWTDAASELGALGLARGVVAGLAAGPAGGGLQLVTVGGAVAGLALLAWQAAAGRQRWLRATAPAPADLERRVARLAGRLGLRRPPVLRLAADGSGPLLTGVARPLIVLPEGVPDLDEAALDAVLAHELAHHRRRDLAVLAAARVLAAVAWFNPLAHVLVRATISAREDGADDLAVEATGGPHTAFADALLRTARLASRSVPLTGIGAHPLGRRLRRLLDDRANRAPRLQWTGLAAVVLVALLTVPGAAGAPSPAGDTRIVKVVVVERVSGF